MNTRFETRDYTGTTPRYGFCLLHGNEPDLIEERTIDLTRLVAGTLDDPFRVATLSIEEHGQLAAEMSAGSLTGGRRVVRVRDCGERLLPTLQRLEAAAGGAAAGGATLVVLQAGALTRKSKLRGWAEQSPRVAAVPCNVDDAGQRRTFIDERLGQAGLTADRDTRALLGERLPRGRRAIVAEIGKLALLAPGTEIEWDDAAALLDVDAGGTVQGTIDAALAGELPAAQTAWQHALEAGTNGVAFVRIMGGEIGRLAALRSEIDRGTPVGDALQRQRIYPRDPRFRRWSTMLPQWPGARIRQALRLLHQAELACKTTGADERLVVSELLTALARRERA